MGRSKKYSILYRSYDGALTQRERALLNDLIKSDPDIYKHKEMCDRIFSDLKAEMEQAYAVEYPATVLKDIDNRKKEVLGKMYAETLNRVFYKVSVVSSALMFLLIIIQTFLINGVSIDEIFTGRDYTIEEIFIPQWGEEENL